MRRGLKKLVNLTRIISISIVQLQMILLLLIAPETSCDRSMMFDMGQ